ncbi:LPS export ABC transporter periplasmic protein LptC [Ferruginibacter albus]|uniref:LPS export ABC transporter periplasmic protein LptC n=1 Tax=Ferruginibacter albus TaxID=2875540 RepID=UPI001CC7964A|nr:LPS export ABC transporter periplasmic protein LptC [Ferruginibacter albus]UAY52103.1 LPS export ABC transporter periplasmic protein LptC [Ferruginibacter albus]
MKHCSSYLIKIFAAGFVGCFFLWSCENTETELREVNKKKASVEEGKDIFIKYSVSGKRKAYLSGPLMYRVQDTVSYIEFPKTVHVDFFGANDSLESKLDAHYAKYKDAESKVFLKDSVVVINIFGDTLHCNELYWDRNRPNMEFYTDKPVRIRTKTHIIDGIGMEARQDFKEWHIIQSTGFVKVPASQFPN